MVRRCKPGQRARIVGCGENKGAIVVIVRPYFGERFDGATWPTTIFGWIVTSLGRPLQSWLIETGERSKARQTMPYDDRSLEPIDDDDPRDEEETERDKPLTVERA